MKFFTFFTTLCFFAYTGFCQSCPPNIDFEEGDFSNWQSSIGTTYTSNNENVINLQRSPPLPDRHQVISANRNGTIPLDEYGNFPEICPYGGKYSVKLGNANVGGEAEGLSYTFTIPATEDTFSFTYFYAVVFEDPQHLIEEQPRFFVTAFETDTRKVINCASYNYVSTGTLPGFKKSALGSSVLYKEWSPASIQFVGLANKQVTLEFKTADCTLGGHFGYAYLDVGSGCSNILATAPFCKETNSLLLNAPYGFQFYTWYNESFTQVVGNEQNLTLRPPPVTAGKFWVDLEPYAGYGCRDTVYALVNPLPVPDTPRAKSNFFYCQNTTAPPFEATPSANAGLLWYADTTKPGSTEPIVPVTAVSGIFHYYVSQKVLFGCESLKKKMTVQVDPVPVTSYKLTIVSACQRDNIFTFISTSANLKAPLYTWNFGDGNIVSGPDSLSHTYKAFGTFAVSLKIINGPVCYGSITGSVTVIPKPLANFSSPPVICQNQTLLALNDQSTVPQQLSTVTKWQWLINGKKTSAQNPASFVPANGGELAVSLLVTTNEGCVSDTLYRILKVHYQPKALFTYAGPLCDNEIIYFKDKSLLAPEAIGENINTWQWQMDNVSLSAQNPTYKYAAASHRTLLMVKSNFGCLSATLDSLIKVNSKPYFAVAVNDSCVYRTIIYKANDLANTVTNWYWDFGSGARETKSTITRYFYKEGNKSFILRAKTADGCRDTLYRSFLIYKNNALAGEDTLAAFNQPVQLNANGGTNNYYTWSPSTGLSDTRLENPVATYDKAQLYRLDAITNEGCDAHSDILITRYKGPDIYIPNAFTPNNDGVNDVLKAFAVGMKKIGHFAVYNRYGEQVFYTTDLSKGWDGRIKNASAQSQAYVAVAEAIDYTGKSFIKKVSVVLIR